LSTYLVTGGAGFIGSHLCHALAAGGHEVRVLDDLSTGQRTNLPPTATLTLGDVADPKIVAQSVDGVDGCFHLAAIASVEKGVTDWLGTHRTNLSGTVTVLDAIRRQGSRIPFIYASSAAVYGDSSTIPIAEAQPCRPLSAYGPRQDPKSPYSGVISIFCERIAAGLPVNIFGDGRQTRDFVYVADVVRALLAAMALRPDYSPVFNVCTGVPTSVEDLASLIAELADRPIDVRILPRRSGEIKDSLGLPDLADSVLGTPGRVKLRFGLSQVLAWMAGPAA
jgi:UDP-glucose 4-epimerase